MLPGGADRPYNRPAMRALTAALLVGLVFAGCGGSSPSPPPTLRHVDGISYQLPAGWHVAGRSLTPHLVNPRELFVAGTGRLVAGRGTCAQVPSAALAAMSPHDVLVTVQERFGSVVEFGPRPRHFALGAFMPSEADQCAGRRPAFASRLMDFRSGGRGFDVLVAVGRAASRDRVAAALALLDSLRIAPRRASTLSPDDAIADRVNGIDVVHPSSWRLYRGAQTRALDARHQIALGTFRMAAHPPDASCAPRTALRLRSAGAGFLFLSEADAHRGPARPAHLRLTGPRPYACFGTSWRVGFREGARSFVAHVYGSARRRAEAVAILDSLRIGRAP